MTIAMTRDLNIFRIDYRFQEAPTYTGRGNCTLGIFLQNLRLQDANSAEPWYLRQTNLLLRLLSTLTLNLFQFTPYHLERGGVRMGTLSCVHFRSKYRLLMGNVICELIKGEKEQYFFSKNGVPLAVYKKEPVSFLEQHRYSIEVIKEHAGDEMPLCLLMAMAVDVIFYPNRGRFSAVKVERTYKLWK